MEEQDTEDIVISEQTKSTQIKPSAGFVQYSELMDPLTMSVTQGAAKTASALFPLHKRTLAHVCLNLNHSILKDYLLDYFLFSLLRGHWLTLFWPLWLCFGEWTLALEKTTVPFSRRHIKGERQRHHQPHWEVFPNTSMWV